MRKVNQLSCNAIQPGFCQETPAMAANDLTRRSFIGRSAALGAIASSPLMLRAQSSMRTHTIPGTTEQLPVVGLGAPDIFIDMPPEGAELPKQVIRAMVDLGGTLMDTPAFFRPNVPIVGEILDEMGLVDDLFLIGKITVNGKEAGIEHLERTVANLGKRPMDMLLIHNMRDMGNHWPTLRDWKEAGRVRYIGVSRTRTTDYTELMSFMRNERPDFIMTGYSIYHADADEALLPLAADLGIGVIGVEAFKAVDDGNVFSLVAGKELPEWVAEFDCESWAQFMLKFVLSHPAMTAVVTETRQVRHVVDNMGAGYGRLPDAAMRRRMSEHLLSL
jgi:diketogulonate reductase-like aldo/keto reductase